jgi:5-methylcytosine-specific restriction endonuclease McrA
MPSDAAMPVEASNLKKGDRRKYQAEHYQKNRKRILERNRAHYAAHREEKSKYSANRYQNNKESITASNEDWARAHPELRRKYHQAWRQRNLERERARGRENRKKAYANNGDHIRKVNREWAHNHPESVLRRSQQRRALKRGAFINLVHIKDWMEGTKRKKSAVCYYCQKKVSTDQIHFDHIIALSKGGAHSVENLCVSCAPCNLSKNNKAVGAWLRIGQQVLSL